MRTYTVVFTPEAQAQLAAIYRYIASASASPSAAARYTEAIVAFCEGMRTFPHRGTQRDDIRPALRITHYRKRSVIAFVVDIDLVSIIGVFHGGQDYEVGLEKEAGE